MLLCTTQLFADKKKDGDTKPIRGSKMNHQVVDGVLNFFVNYDFFTVKTEDQTPMETMTASTDVKEGG